MTAVKVVRKFSFFFLSFYYPLSKQVIIVLLCACRPGLRKPILNIGTLGQGRVWLAVLLLLQ